MSRVVILMLSFLILATSSYGQLKMALSEDFIDGMSEYKVKGRQGLMIRQCLSFGAFKTATIKRSWTKGSSATMGLTRSLLINPDYEKIITVDYVKRKQKLYFAMQDSAGNTAEAYCISKFEARDFNIGNNRNNALNLLGDLLTVGINSSSIFYVQIYAEKPQPWQMFHDNICAQNNPDNYHGTLSHEDGRRYTIRASSRVETPKGDIRPLPFAAAGFEFFDEANKLVAAVSMINSGVVFLKELPRQERILLATACAALLLQEEI